MLRGPVRALAEGPTGTPPAPSRFGDFWPKGDGLLWGRGGAKADVLRRTDSTNNWQDFKGLGHIECRQVVYIGVVTLFHHLRRVFLNSAPVRQVEQLPE